MLKHSCKQSHVVAANKAQTEDRCLAFCGLRSWTWMNWIRHIGSSAEKTDTLWLFNIAMENGPFIDDFPIEPSIYEGFSMAMLNNQRVNHLTCMLSRMDSHPSLLLPGLNQAFRSLRKAFPRRQPPSLATLRAGINQEIQALDIFKMTVTNSTNAPDVSFQKTCCPTFEWMQSGW